MEVMELTRAAEKDGDYDAAEIDRELIALRLQQDVVGRTRFVAKENANDLRRKRKDGYITSSARIPDHQDPNS